jgi:glycosyltransferase involved in cell wall biosynthesis
VRAYARLVLQAVTTPRPDVVVILYPGHVDMLVLAPVWKLRGVPVVFDPLLSLHDTVVSDRAMVDASSPKARLLARLDRAAFAFADLVVVDTPEVRDFYVARFGVRADKALVVWPGTDIDRLGAPAEDSEVPGRVLFHGSFIPLHGIETIVRAAALLADTDLRFRLVGNGQQRPAVEALIRELGGVPALTLVDPMPLEGIGDEIRAASLCLGIFGTTPKTGRVVPFKVFEYMALRRPVVTGDTPAARHALGADVVLVPPGDATALADAIRALMGDDDRRHRLGRAAGDRFARRFSTAAQVASLRASLARVIRHDPAAA